MKPKARTIVVCVVAILGLAVTLVYLDRRASGSLILPEIGDDIEQVKRDYEAEGYYVSGIADSTGKGEFVTMSIALEDTSLIDKLMYAADIRSPKSDRVTHIIVRAGMDGGIREVEFR